MFQDNLNIKFFQKILRRDNYFAEKANNFVVVKLNFVSLQQKSINKL